MTVTHPIGDDLLLGYAAGRLPAAMDLMVASAVSLDDDARARLAGFEELGGALVERSRVAPLRDDSFECVMERIQSAPPEETVRWDEKAPSEGAVLPKPLRDAAGGDLDDLRWKSVGMGVRQVVLESGADGTARLLSIPAGQAMPDHGHSGTEVTLVLKGAFIDGDERFARGDIEVADDQTQHMPVADLGEDCICLVVTDAPLKFRQLLPRIAQRFLNI
ncbi:ChrR family anti-sigma-E factor [Jannaschia aquimarina]|uniref:ChrR protein n=1 Tax=Jannaschia aquimarina TaxID=935700 RepID=A0A0D1D5U8_9RHOB|nr:ChrR family anti-sigma-E factor [Jannaschia aquimarina]KIT15313.1 Anti-sigma-E factor ChrR [Jannaschia aquimarina]SNS51023.1 anti-ECFsigma factor, ChrR [Jannaschia aquimarina]